MGKKTCIGVKLECRRFVWNYYKCPKTCRHTQVDWLVASYECCTIEGSCPRPLAGRLLHQPPPCGLNLLQQRSKQRKLELCVRVWLDIRWQSARLQTFGQSASYNQIYITAQMRSYVILKTIPLYWVTCQLLQNKSLCWCTYLVMSLYW